MNSLPEGFFGQGRAYHQTKHGGSMKKRFSTILLIIVFLAGLGLMMYPTISDVINKAHQSVVMSSYDEQVSNMSDEEFDAILEDARRYNSKLTTNEFPRDEEDLEGNAEYKAAMDPLGTGVMGYIRIDSIGLKMPIYHGTREAVLQTGVGHIPTTSLPVGGKSTHAVITGHRGLPSARLFTDIDKLEIGDMFYIYVLDDVLAYKVDKITTVLPAQTKDLQIIEGEDHVTLVTCTPYGVNTHRLLVRGTRTDYKPKIEKETATQVIKRTLNTQTIITLICSAVFVLLFIFVFIKTKKRRKKA
jgi:sortase A